MDRYGIETVDQVMAAEIDASERRCVSGCAACPTGSTARATSSITTAIANRLYHICLAVHKTRRRAGVRSRRLVAAGAGLHQLHVVRA